MKVARTGPGGALGAGVKPWDPRVAGGAEVAESSQAPAGEGLGAAAAAGLRLRRRRAGGGEAGGCGAGPGAAARGVGARAAGLWSGASKEEEETSEEGSEDTVLGGCGPGWAESI